MKIDLRDFHKRVPTKTQRTDRITLSIDPKVGEGLRKFCYKHELAMSRFVEALIKEAIKK